MGLRQVLKGKEMLELFDHAMSREAMEHSGLSGQGSIEWILIVALIAVAIIGGLTALSTQMKNKLSTVTSTIQNATTK